MARRRWIALGLAVAIASMAFAACGKSEERTSYSTPEFTAFPTASPQPRSASEELAAVPSGSLVFLSAYGHSPNLYAVNADGTGLTQLTDSPESDRVGGFSPNGKLVAYASRGRDDGKPDGLYVMSPDGSHSRLVAKDAPMAWFRSWSSQGRISYVQGVQGYGDGWIANSDGSDNVLISERDACLDADWAPNGKNLVMCQCSAFEDPAACSLSVFDEQGGLVRTLLEKGIAVPHSPRWSPDGTQILFTSGQGSGALFVVNADGTGLRALYQIPADTEGAIGRWSPDGSQIMLRTSNQILMVSTTNGSTRTIGDGFSISPDGSEIAVRKDDEIHVVSLADGSSRIVASARNVEGFFWSPNGDKIAYTSRVPMTFESTLSVVDADGGEPKDLAYPVDNTGIAWSSDGKQIIFASSQKRREGVWWISPGGSKRGRLDELSKQNVPPAEPTVEGVIGGCRRMLEEFSCLSPDGKSEALVLPDSKVLTIKDLASGAMRDIEIEGADVWKAPPTWSNDGTRVAVYAGDPRQGKLYIVDVTTGEAGSVAADAGLVSLDSTIVWSPDDSYVYYVKGTVCMEGCAPGFLYRIKTDGTGEERVVDIRVDSVYGFKP